MLFPLLDQVTSIVIARVIALQLPLLNSVNVVNLVVNVIVIIVWALSSLHLGQGIPLLLSNDGWRDSDFGRVLRVKELSR